MSQLELLELEHQQLEKQLQSLSRRARLTQAEQEQMVQLKRAKLQRKDAIFALRLEASLQTEGHAKQMGSLNL